MTSFEAAQQLEKWRSAKKELKRSYEELLALLDDESSTQDLLHGYLRAKRLSAVAFQSLMLASIPDHRAAWDAIRKSVGQALDERYSGLLPDWAIKVPYGSDTHRMLFCILAEHRGEPVSADYLRVVAADAVHAERRVRELREIGLDVVAAKANGRDSYTLTSFDVDLDVIPTIAVNHIRAYKGIPETEKKRLQDIARRK
ncbi:hypothetical protein [Actinoplanes sp. NPDC023714]|uniref:hypothetical protein n=1 Tax=Actinoplanes sp. NPDC023714 TaxID=3154322 RepID=UPI0033CF408C